MEEHYTIIVIGAGIVGTALAWELSKFSDSVLLMERERDVAMGATRANSGIVHGGYSAKAGTLKGELSSLGNRMYAELARDLGFPFTRIGSYVLALNDEDEAILEELRENGLRSGVSELEIHTGSAVLDREPRLNPRLKSGLWCGETGIVSPYEAAIAFAEQAVSNGAVLKLNCGAERIEPLAPGRDERGFRVTAAECSFTAAAVVNAAGVHADRIAAMAGLQEFTVRPRRGQYLLLKRGAADGLNSVIFQPPTAHGKGVLVSPTTWGNLLVGPNAEDGVDREERGATFEGLQGIALQARQSMPELKFDSLIRYFAGIRPAADRGDFIIGESPSLPGFFQTAGIESPGLTSAPAIAVMVSRMLQEKGYIGRWKTASAGRRPIALPAPLQPFADILKLVDLPPGDPRRIVCRCEQVPEAVVTDALQRPIPIDSLDAVKRRTRAGMGACQGQFCGPRVKELIVRTRNLPESAVGMAERKDPELLKRLKAL